MKDLRNKDAPKDTAAAAPQGRTQSAVNAPAHGSKAPPSAPGHPKPSDAPMVAAKGDDDLMSKQQYQGMPSTDEIKGKWKQYVGDAKIAWGKLTEDELLKSEGHEQKLAGLVQERYAITRDEASKQVHAFLDKHKH